MKKRERSTIFRISWRLLAVFVVAAAFIACDRDDDDDPINGIPAEDGIYVTGPATGFDDLELEGMMDPGREEGEGFASLLRDGMYEKFMYLSAGDFNIVSKSGATETEYGWEGGTQDTFDPGGADDEVAGDVHRGAYEAGGVSFNAPAAGFYHIVFDESAGRVYYTRIQHWALIGDATEQGWSAEYPLTETSMSATEAEWEVTGLVLRERGGYKFRYNEGWKITTDNFIIFANIGRGDTDTDFITGGGEFPHPEQEGEYTVTLSWTRADGFSQSYERTGDVDPLPEYPDSLYMIGDALNPEDGDGDGTPDGWQWDLTDEPMVPSHSKPWLFWKIVWLHEGGEFKFSPERAWAGDFGRTGDATDGVFEINGDNLPVPGGTGYYMVVVNLETNQIAVTEPQVYLIGDAVNNWDTANPDARFEVDNDNEILTLTRNLETGDLRIYAWFDHVDDWFTDWWQHEFIILDGEIVFRGRGDDQERVQAPAGENRIDLNFRTHEGTITQP